MGRGGSGKIQAAGMTSTLDFATVTAAIKTQLAFIGLTVKDTLDMPDVINPTQCPVLFPEVRNGFVSNVVINYLTTGGEGLRMGDLTYELRYTLAYKPVGEGRGLYGIIPGLMDMTKKIIDRAITKDVLDGTTGIIDFYLSSVSGNGLVMDPAASTEYGFYGFEYLFKVTEFIN
jgi:hypothetical protein